MSEPEDKKLRQLSGKKPNAGSPNAVAGAMMGAHQFKTDAAKHIWRYDVALGKWVICPEGWVKRQAWDIEGPKVSEEKRRSEVVAAIMAATHEDKPAWGRVPEYEIAFSSGVLDIRNGTMRPNEPEDLLQRVVPWAYDPDARCDLWRQCLREWLDDDAEGRELQDALQEFFGYVLTQHAKYKKCAIMPGPSDAGKSQVIYVAMALVGRDACCQLGVENMDDPTQRAVIVGKALNVMTELTGDALIREGGFKTIVSTEEPLLINDKYKSAYMYIPTVKCMIATNRLPVITDRSEATYNRLLPIPFDNVIPKEKQDRRLPERLLAEMPGIAAWAVQGAKRLFERGGEWPVPARSKRLLDEYKRDQNQAGQFLAECCIPQANAAEPIANLVKQFNQWSNGQKVSNKGFAEMLRSALLDKRAVKKVARKAETAGFSINCLIGWKFVGQVRNATFAIEPEDAAIYEGEIASAGEIQDHVPAYIQKRSADAGAAADPRPAPPVPERAE